MVRTLLKWRGILSKQGNRVRYTVEYRLSLSMKTFVFNLKSCPLTVEMNRYRRKFIVCGFFLSILFLTYTVRNSKGP